jgi:hypothetical protein
VLVSDTAANHNHPNIKWRFIPLLLSRRAQSLPQKAHVTVAPIAAAGKQIVDWLAREHLQLVGKHHTVDGRAGQSGLDDGGSESALFGIPSRIPKSGKIFPQYPRVHEPVVKELDHLAVGERTRPQ